MDSLKQYLLEAEPFCWRNHNCLKFVSNALVAQGAEPLPEDWHSGSPSERSTARYYLKTIKKYGYPSIEDALDERLYREFSLYPQNGWVVCRKINSVLGKMFGVVFNDQSWFLSEKGAVPSRLNPTDVYWSI